MYTIRCRPIHCTIITAAVSTLLERGKSSGAPLDFPWFYVKNGQKLHKCIYSPEPRWCGGGGCWKTMHVMCAFLLITTIVAENSVKYVSPDGFFGAQILLNSISTGPETPPRTSLWNLTMLPDL